MHLLLLLVLLLVLLPLLLTSACGNGTLCANYILCMCVTDCLCVCVPSCVSSCVCLSACVSVASVYVCVWLLPVCCSCQWLSTFPAPTVYIPSFLPFSFFTHLPSALLSLLSSPSISLHCPPLLSISCVYFQRISLVKHAINIERSLWLHTSHLPTHTHMHKHITHSALNKYMSVRTHLGGTLSVFCVCVCVCVCVWFCFLRNKLPHMAKHGSRPLIKCQIRFVLPAFKANKRIHHTYNVAYVQHSCAGSMHAVHCTDICWH